ncbi:MAG: hypothetical protein ACJAUO_001020 [Sediminicola sp.]|jgi:hypothetical protein
MGSIKRMKNIDNARILKVFVGLFRNMAYAKKENMLTALTIDVVRAKR